MPVFWHATAFYCLYLFDIPFLLGISAFWSNPREEFYRTKPGRYIDRHHSGYLFFQRDGWHVPSFHVAKLGAPSGTNIIFTDSIPWVALAGRIAFLAMGTSANLYGLWTASCFVASAVTMTALVATLGQRNIAAAPMATAAGLCMPALLARWGHMSLMAQFEIPLTLIFYMKNRQVASAQSLIFQGAGLLWLSLWTHAYIFVMVGAIVLTTLAQAWSNRAISTRLVSTVLVSLWSSCWDSSSAASGYLQSKGSFGAEGVGIYSMNLISPFVPQRSGVFPTLRDTIADATGGQYEGFSYLGLGLVTLLLMTFGAGKCKLRCLSHHRWMAGCSSASHCWPYPTSSFLAECGWLIFRYPGRSCMPSPCSVRRGASSGPSCGPWPRWRLPRPYPFTGAMEPCYCAWRSRCNGSIAGPCAKHLPRASMPRQGLTSIWLHGSRQSDGTIPCLCCRTMPV